MKKEWERERKKERKKGRKKQRKKERMKEKREKIGKGDNEAGQLILPLKRM